MSHKNRVANLLTGASLAALSFIGARVSAVAGTIPPPNAGNVTFSTLFGTNEDWVNIIAPADLGTVTNDITVSDGFDNPQTLAEDAIAVFITAGASVDTFINTANANITAIEKAFGTAYNNFSTNEATATGLRIEGDVGQVTNAGVIQGIAWAHNSESAAFAEAEAKGIEYDANQGDADEIARVINESTGNIFASAYAVVTGYDHGSNLDATAEAKGIDMFVTGTDSGLAEVINSGDIVALARAHATGVDTAVGGHDVDANAEAVGVEQVIVGPETATASVDNTGSLIGASATAYAYTTGLFNDAWADATATGVAQIIEDSPNGTATVINGAAGVTDATIYAYAQAYAESTADDADAEAAAAGVVQAIDAWSGGIGNVADANVTNYGSIYGSAYATAVGGEDAQAAADAAGVVQLLEDALVATADVVNSGNITGYAAALANAGTGDATAWADGTGIIQDIDDSPDGTATVVNQAGGTIYGTAYAFASSTEDDAEADAEAAGIVQAVDAWSGGGIGTAAVAAVSNYGVIGAYATAHAVANAQIEADDADAWADAAGVVQLLEDAATANASVYNFDEITGRARALAFAEDDATADADAWGIIQDIDDSPIATADVLNAASAYIRATAYAYAESTDEDADGSALAIGVEQVVDAWSGGIGTSAAAAVTNYGYIDARATGIAVATGDFGNNAWADAEAVGVLQEVEDAALATATVNNFNQIGAYARASAYAEDEADADAEAGGVVQDIDDSPDATASVFNAAGAYISATAYAFASSTGDDAEADAEAVGIDQFVDAWAEGARGTVGIAQVTNYGYVLAQATAYAVANANVIADDAEAFADATGVFQHVEDVGQPIDTSPEEWGVAEANVDNFATIRGFATALAYGEDDADADADAFGVRQELDDVAAGLAHVYNGPSGLIAATAYAFAQATDDDADAEALAVGVDQSVDAWVGGPGVKGTAEVLNDGTISALARAQAVALEDGDEADADATATGVFQYVEDVGWPQDTHLDSGIALALVDNSYVIQALATASATAPDEADADAEARGVVQELEDSPNAYATVINGDRILASAYAFANATVWDATADASATGVDQSVDAWAGAPGLRASALVDNTGIIQGKAFANATGQDDAEADAEAAGVRQFVEDAINVEATVVNATSAYIIAYAQGSAYAIDDDAEVDATATGVSQEADDFVNANLEVQNSGHIVAQAVGNALSWGDNADAEVEARGVEQELDDGEVGVASVINGPTGMINAFAAANATATQGAWNAWADATATGVYQESDDLEVAYLNVENSNIIGASASSYAFSSRDDADADARAYGVVQEVDDTETVFGTVTNNIGATIGAYANASAYGLDDVEAFASAVGVVQDAWNTDAIRFNVYNDSYIHASANAFASASLWDATADAEATGVWQEGDDGFDSVMQALVSNSTGAAIEAYANASAIGEDDAWSEAWAVGVGQDADDISFATLEVQNAGRIMGSAYATSYAITDDAGADAEAAGVVQYGDDGAFFTAIVNNQAGAYIGAYAEANATADTGAWNAYAEAWAGGIEQSVEETTGTTLSVINSAYIHAEGNANALALFDDAEAWGSATGVWQEGNDIDLHYASVTNELGAGIRAEANAAAIGPDTATANAWAVGVGQDADESGFAELTVDNFGYIGGRAVANASGAWAEARASAFGIRHEFDETVDPNSIIFNSGEVWATALADANGVTSDHADAWAAGMDLAADNTEIPFITYNIDVENTGAIRVLADAEANYDAEARAVGIYAFSEWEKEGTIANLGGVIYASAFANAGQSELAHAIGIWDPAKVNNMEIVNSGLINAYAELGGLATFQAAGATGILITGHSEEGFPFQTDNDAQATITNLGGTIWAGFSFDGGASLERGNAINLAGLDPNVTELDNVLPAPNSVLIELKGELAEGSPGSGHVFGDIVLDNHDTVNVTDGKTFFNGIMYSPYQAFASESGLEGNEDNHLNIFNDGDLVLCQTGWTGACDPADWAGAGPNEGNPQFDPQETNFGPAYVLIDHVTIGDIEGNGSSGTITYQLTPIAIPGDPTLGFAGIGTYPQVGANRIDLIDNSIFRAWYLPGLYGNQTVYKGVMVADEINGTFESVVDNSFLLKSNLDYDPAEPLYPHENIDLVVERTPFNKVGGSQNQKSVGGGLEGAYEHLLKKYGVGPLPDDKFAGLLGDLLLIDNKKDYLLALDQLSGAQIAQGLQSIVWSLRPLNESITDRMDCFVQVAGVEPLKLGGGSTPSTGCFTPGQIQAWGRVFGGWNNADGDINAPSYDEDQFAFWGGLDYAFNPNWYVGVAGGYFDANMSFGRFGGVPGGSFDYDGGQLAIYGGWDNCEWYSRAIISWGWYDGDSNRLVAVKASPVDPSGSFDADAIAFYNEAGYRFLVGSHSQVTPYVGIGASNGEINSFTEKDPFGTGANLKIHDSDGDSLFTVLGVRWNGAWGNFRPQLGLGWEHQFEDTAQTITASFAQDKSGTKFKVTGSDLGDDAVLVEAGGTYLIGPSAELTFGYMGRWYENYDSQWVTGRFTWKFGAAAPAAAAPAPHEPLKIGTE